jgi:predicted ATPase
VIKKCGKGVAFFEFDELFDSPMGSADFLAICRNFHSIIIRNIPIIKVSERNKARRFILFVIKFAKLLFIHVFIYLKI